MREGLRVVANLSLMFTEVALLARPRAAYDAGFDEVEFWWPFEDTGRPSDRRVQAFVDAVRDSGVQLTAMNLYGGDMHGGERGVASHPEREAEFVDSIDIAVGIAESLGTRLFNVPYGHRREDLSIAVQDEQADRMLAAAADALAAVGGTLMVEALSGWPLYPVKSMADAAVIADRIRPLSQAGNLGVLLDQYHVECNGGDPVADIREYSGYLSHVQVADTPHRGEPGTGRSDIGAFVDTLLEHGYPGAIALEYVPRTSTADSLSVWPAQWATRWGVQSERGVFRR